MRKFLKVSILVVFSYTSIVSSTYGQNIAHKEWDLLDKPVRRAHWVWTNFATETEAVQDAYLNFCRNKSINEVYMSIAEYYWYPNSTYEIPNKEALAQFIAKANNFGIKIWGTYYLLDDELGLDYLGDTNAGEHLSKAELIADAAAQFNREYPNSGLHGIQNDNEPKNSSLLVPFIEYCKAATDRIDDWNVTLKAEGARPLLHSAALRPSWIKSDKVIYNGVDNFVAYHYLTVSKHAAVMNYTSNGNSFKITGETILQWADDIPGEQIVTIGFETDDILGLWPDSQYETYADEIYAENDQTRFNRLESDMDAAEASFVNYSSYGRLAVHSDGYIGHWFDGVEDFAIIGNAPSGTQFVDLFVDASPSAGTTLPSGPNLVLNPSFENGDTSWSVWGGGSIVSNNAHEGSFSLIAVAEGGAEQIITGLSPNTSYTLTAYAKSSNGTSNAVIGVKNHGGSQKTASTTNMTYQLVTVLFTTGSTSTSATIFGFNPTNNAVYFDNFNLTDGTVTKYAPIVALTAPSNGTDYSELQQVLIVASASDSDGSVSSVEFFINELSVGTDYNSPYSINWTIPAYGSYEITAKATDNDGLSTTSSVVSITATSANLVLNPSFENGDTSWSVWGGGSIVSNNAQEGSSSLIAVAEGGAEQIITGLSPNTSYTLTAYAKSSNGSSNAVVGVKNHGGSQKTASTTNMTYQLVTVLFTTGSTSTSAKIFGYNSTNNTVYFDNFHLAKSPLISARFMNEIERDELLYNFKIYPNPASSNLTLEVKNLDIEQDTYVRLYDLTGRCVLSQFLNLYEGSNQVNLSLHSMQKGTYMIRLQFQHEYIQKRLIIK